MATKACALGLVLAGAVTACGSGGGGDGVASLGDSSGGGSKKSQQTSSSTKDPQEAFRAFASCMREHGIDMPDPQVSSDGKGGGFTMQAPIGGASGSEPNEEFEKANAACQKHLDGVVRGGNGKGPSGADQEKAQRQALAFAKCMRDHGIDFPDPKFDGGMTTQIGPGENVDPNDPKLQAAMKQCQKTSGLSKPGQGVVTNGKGA
jgi:hypothetical protein